MKQNNNKIEACQVETPVMLPETFNEIYDAVKSLGFVEYDFDTDESMNNIASMDYFLSVISDLKQENIALNDGTQVYLKSWAWAKEIVLNSGGRGDFYSHRVTAEWAT